MPTQPESAEGGAKQYVIHNAARSVHSRAARAAGATHKGLKQHVFDTQQRLVRGRPLYITEQKLVQNLAELKKKAAAGLIIVKTPDGRRVNLETLLPEAAKPASPKPSPVLDSVANDQQGVGEERGIYPDGAVIPHGGGPREDTAETSALEPTAADFAESVPSELPTVEEPAIKAAKKGGKHK